MKVKEHPLPKNPIETTEYKQMILKVNTETVWPWLKAISENTSLAMPKVVELVLGDAIKQEPKAYIDQINKIEAKEKLKKLEEEAKVLEAERRRLAHLLES